MRSSIRSLSRLPLRSFKQSAVRSSFISDSRHVRSFSRLRDEALSSFLDHHTPSLVQHSAPDFTATAVIDGEFKTISLSDYKGKWVILFFYPLDFTFVCPTEILAFSDRVNEFTALNTQLLTASVDSEYSHLAWSKMPREAGGLSNINIPMIADITKSISKLYGVLLSKAGVSLRGLFIIDPAGIVRQITINDLPIGRSVDETLRLLRALQFHEKHGEVCPADWKEGGETMVPDPVKSLDYFKKQKKK